MTEDKMKHTYLTVSERKRISIDGVKNILAFDEELVRLESDGGDITVEGQGLKIESLSREGGVIDICGVIEGVYYSKKKRHKRGLSKLLG